MSDFDEYIRQGEPGRSAKAAAWQTAIGLQDVDGLKPSAYLVDTAKRHIEGDITIDQAIADYRRLGYSETWINRRIKSIEIRK